VVTGAVVDSITILRHLAVSRQGNAISHLYAVGMIFFGTRFFLKKNYYHCFLMRVEMIDFLKEANIFVCTLFSVQIRIPKAVVK